MKNKYKILTLGVILSVLIFFTGCINETNVAEYEIVFNATWSQQTHPDDFPPNPHFSGLIGASHNNDVKFWEEGALASEGIKNMAETGSKNPLNMEIGAEIVKKNVFELISGGGIGTSPGSINLTFQVSENYPLVTLVTMIAPSPDWFVGVDSLNLFEEGSFVEEKTVMLYAYDAGTDSGNSYTSIDEPTDPPVPIFKIEGYPFISDQSLIPLGTFVFTKL